MASSSPIISYLTTLPLSESSRLSSFLSQHEPISKEEASFSQYSSTNPNQMSTTVRVMIAIVCFIVITLSLIGNSLVVTVIIKFKRLKNTTNYILLSLAIADLTVSLLVMLPAMVQDVIQKWIFNNLFCKFYNAFDITCCTASILHLLLVAIDRYIAIFKPLKYKQLVRKAHVFAIVIAVWTLSLCLSFIPIFLGWNKEFRSDTNQIQSNNTSFSPNLNDNAKAKAFQLGSNEAQSSNSLTNLISQTLSSSSLPNKTSRTTMTTLETTTQTLATVVETETCQLEANVYYAIISSCTSFYIPLIIMSIVYVQIYIVARRQANAIAEIELRSKNLTEASMSSRNLNHSHYVSGSIISNNMFTPGNNNRNSRILNVKNSIISNNSNNNNNNNDALEKEINEILKENGELTNAQLNEPNRRTRLQRIIRSLKTIERKRTKDTKAIKTLGIIMGKIKNTFHYIKYQ
jgi:hypothetical protein